jgi:predicted DNA-binding protein
MMPVTSTTTKEDAVRNTASISRVVCPPELVERLKKVSAATGAPQSWHIRQALEKYLDEKEQE